MMGMLRHILSLRSQSRCAKNSDVIPYIRCLVRSDVRTILDIGCGKLWDNNPPSEDILLSCFNDEKYRILGIDIFPECVEWRRKNMKIGEYYLLDARQILSLLPRKFDLVLAHHLIEHLSKEDGWKLLSDVSELALKQIIIGCPIGFTDTEYAVKLHGNEYERHLSGWYAEEFERLGFKVIRIKNVILGIKLLR